MELWKSDGTAAGTVHGQGHRPGDRQLHARRVLTNVERDALLRGQRRGQRRRAVEERRDGRRHRAWSRTSTPARPARTPRASSPSAARSSSRPTTASAATELWKSDGTAAGTVLVKDIYPGSGGSSIQVPDQRGRDALLLGLHHDVRGGAVEERRDGRRHDPWSRTSTPESSVPARKTSCPSAGFSTSRPPMLTHPSGSGSCRRPGRVNRSAAQIRCDLLSCRPFRLGFGRGVIKVDGGAFLISTADNLLH